MAWPPRFLFVSGRLALDFAQSGGEGRYARWERLNGPEDLADWLAASPLGLRVDRVRRRDLDAARALRRAIWSAGHAVAAGEAPAAEDVRAVNAHAARPDLVPVLDGDRRRWAGGASVPRALSTIARDAIELFGGDLRGRVRECRNPRCPLLFVDLSRPGKRAWCTMRRCGNLQKTATYRRRKRVGRRRPGS